MTTQLNYDIYEIIALYCDARTQLTLSEVNKDFYSIIDQNKAIFVKIAEYQSNRFEEYKFNFYMDKCREHGDDTWFDIDCHPLEYVEKKKSLKGLRSRGVYTV
jgi:hypothetical protein